MPIDLKALGTRMEQELITNILPFWMHYPVDRQNGGFFGALTNDLQVHNEIERSLVLCARVLWTFSAAYRKYHDANYLDQARHAYTYLVEKFLDRQFGGMFWWIDCTGNPVNDRKQTYGQAFAIYGLSDYYLATGDMDALNLARELYGFIEQYAFEPAYGGYIEGCTRQWGPLRDMRLSEKEPFNCPKSMNTLLHILEGYTNLLRCWPDPRLVDSQTRLLKLFLDRVIDVQTYTTRLFFDKDWSSLSQAISYGHDIEASWLLVEAAEGLGDLGLIDRTRTLAVKMAESVLLRGLDRDGAVMHEGTSQAITDADRHWWCQAEGIVGFTNAYQISRNPDFARAALRIWDFIEFKMIDRQFGEWFKILAPDGTPVRGQMKTGPWEDPYHHARACLEMSRRTTG